MSVALQRAKSDSILDFELRISDFAIAKSMEHGVRGTSQEQRARDQKEHFELRISDCEIFNCQELRATQFWIANCGLQNAKN
jgi:hypothetical protein